MNETTIGNVVAVHGFRVTVELSQEVRSAVRSHVHGTSNAISINAYVTFELGPGQRAVGIITDLDSRETYDPSDEELTLQLARPRRTATVQLLGSVRPKPPSGALRFDAGLGALPTLGMPAELASSPTLKSVFEDAPLRNQPEGNVSGEDYDSAIRLGLATAPAQQLVKASYNDLFSRPLAIVGNTGSGKSNTVCQLVQSALHDRAGGRPRFFILDINGEYGNAFSKAGVVGGKKPNHLYVNGKEFGLPIWLMSTSEVCEWLSVAEQTQQPALVNLWSLAKGGGSVSLSSGVRECVIRLDSLVDLIHSGKGPYKGKNAGQIWDAFIGYAGTLTPSSSANSDIGAIGSLLKAHESDHSSFGADEVELTQRIASLKTALDEQNPKNFDLSQQSADKPIYFDLSYLRDPAKLLEAARIDEGEHGFRQFLRGLQLRIGNRLQDQRWSCFLNYDSLKITSFADWLSRLGIGVNESGNDTCIIDCSMIGHEVLPYICGIIGRLLLDLREHTSSDKRFHEPWAIVLEEAHNYVTPIRQNETRGVGVSRDAFERIAKEGRKFGLSLIVASQRPGDVSATILSQCANFIMHRLQNPDDIDHFRRIVPSQARRLLDQITILSAGEAIVLGSSMNVPARVQIDKPRIAPHSQSASPHMSWLKNAQHLFNLDDALTAWGLGNPIPGQSPAQAKPASKKKPK